jgi:hypothetical protein
MRECTYRDRLIEEWSKALAYLSNFIACALDDTDSNTSGTKERAELHADNARTLLAIHRAEHGC